MDYFWLFSPDPFWLFLPDANTFGFECCQHGMKTYFIKMSELRDRFTMARRTGKEAAILNGLVRPSCLIIDEVGHCEFDKENTRLFFDLIDRRYKRKMAARISPRLIYLPYNYNK